MRNEKMASVQNTDVCPVCGEEYWYDFDCKTFEYTKLSACRCDRWRMDAEDFLKMHGLWEEFKRYHEKREEERKQEQD